MTKEKGKAKNWIQLVLAFVVGTVCYIAGFLGGGILIGIANSFVVILPKTIDLGSAQVTSAALAANLLGIFVFEKIDKKHIHMIAFSIWLIMLAVAYFVLCIIGGDYHLLWYSVLGVIINGVMIAQTIRDTGEEK